MATIHKGVRIPSSARDLELFSSMKGSGAAAQEIIRQLKKDITRLQREGKKLALADDIPGMAKLIGTIYDEGVYKLMLKYSDFGATDTEPRYHIGQALVDAAKSMMGIDYYCPELGDWI